MAVLRDATQLFIAGPDANDRWEVLDQDGFIGAARLSEVDAHWIVAKKREDNVAKERAEVERKELKQRKVRPW